MHPQRTLIESALNVYLKEAQEGDLHNHLRMEISRQYGIDPNHRDWSKIKPHVDIEKYANAVYDQFPDHIDSKYIGDSDSAYDKEAYHDESLAREAHEDFHEFVSGVHHAYHNR